MRIMVYSLLWVMQDFVHQQYDPSALNPLLLASYLRVGGNAQVLWFVVCLTNIIS